MGSVKQDNNDRLDRIEKSLETLVTVVSENRADIAAAHSRIDSAFARVDSAIARIDNLTQVMVESNIRTTERINLMEQRIERLEG